MPNLNVLPREFDFEEHFQRDKIKIGDTVLVVEPFTWAWVGIHLAQGAISWVGGKMVERLYAHITGARDPFDRIFDELRSFGHVVRQEITVARIDELRDGHRALCSALANYHNSLSERQQDHTIPLELSDIQENDLSALSIEAEKQVSRAEGLDLNALPYITQIQAIHVNILHERFRLNARYKSNLKNAINRHSSIQRRLRILFKKTHARFYRFDRVIGPQDIARQDEYPNEMIFLDNNPPPPPSNRRPPFSTRYDRFSPNWVHRTCRVDWPTLYDAMRDHGIKLSDPENRLADSRLVIGPQGMRIHPPAPGDYDKAFTFLVNTQQPRRIPRVQDARNRVYDAGREYLESLIEGERGRLHQHVLLPGQLAVKEWKRVYRQQIE